MAEGRALKSRCSTWAARLSRCGCAYQAVVVAAPVIRKNLLRLCMLRIGDHAVSLRAVGANSVPGAVGGCPAESAVVRRRAGVSWLGVATSQLEETWVQSWAGHLAGNVICARLCRIGTDSNAARGGRGARRGLGVRVGRVAQRPHQQGATGRSPRALHRQSGRASPGATEPALLQSSRACTRHERERACRRPLHC